MRATYTWDVFTSLDGFGGYDEHGDWGGYWGKDGPEFLARRLAVATAPHRLVLGAKTFRMFTSMIGVSVVPELDPVNQALRDAPATVLSATLDEHGHDWPDATVVRGDAAEVVDRLKNESDVPLRSHGSLSLNRALMAAGLVDLVQVTIFPVIAGRTGDDPVFAGADDFDLELVETHLFDGRTQELVYLPTPHPGGR
ncbi:dihydrofolate reductase family protein [Jatrophihabitans fulvus]